MTLNSKVKDSRPAIVVIAGPNGAGKSTSAPQLLAELMGVAEFVNPKSEKTCLKFFRSFRASNLLRHRDRQEGITASFSRHSSIFA